MKDKILELVVYPGLAILFCLAFGVPFVYAGFQQVNVAGVKDEEGAVMITVDRGHYFGLIHQKFQIENVHQASWVNTRVRRVGKPRRLLSGVYLIAEEEEKMLFFGSSNLDDDLKRQAINEVNAFIDDPGSQDLTAEYQIRNIFGWFGLPFLILGIWGLLAWPFSIIRLRDIK